MFVFAKYNDRFFDSTVEVYFANYKIPSQYFYSTPHADVFMNGKQPPSPMTLSKRERQPTITHDILQLLDTYDV